MFQTCPGHFCLYYGENPINAWNKQAICGGTKNEVGGEGVTYGYSALYCRIYSEPERISLFRGAIFCFYMLHLPLAPTIILYYI